MGPSGSGKITLLKILGRRLQENVRGTVTPGKHPTSYNYQYEVSLTQDDVLFPQLTVEETFVFLALLGASKMVNLGSMKRGLKEEVSAAIGILCGMAAVAKKEASHYTLPRKGAVRKG
ncbi:ATP-binding cassette sub- G member 1 [Datura stramonium]|uniref:ATP-binding cassette sub- G member 1 n=1 Tax=Datura stramonium TaxID=4076 RepID=A0ABS8WH13_DATST|nr:ATP-binding cassette sub- G member 1 [Datura stramonium]